MTTTVFSHQRFKVGDFVRHVNDSFIPEDIASICQVLRAFPATADEANRECAPGDTISYEVVTLIGKKLARPFPQRQLQAATIAELQQTHDAYLQMAVTLAEHLSQRAKANP